MAVRGWLGYSRRWWGGPQVQVQPVEVVSVGSDESDGAALNATGGDANPGGGFFATHFLVALERDVFVEQIATDSNQGLLLAVLAPGAAPLPLGINLRGEQYAHPAYSSDPFAASAAGVSVRDPRGALVFEAPGLLVPVGSFLQVQHPVAGTNMRLIFYFREAAT